MANAPITATQTMQYAATLIGLRAL